MEQNIVVVYKNALAHYRITKEINRVYHAKLLFYDGKEGDKPCESATLIEGYSRWWGCDNEELLLSLGAAIDSLFESPEYLASGKKDYSKPMKPNSYMAI